MQYDHCVRPVAHDLLFGGDGAVLGGDYGGSRGGGGARLVHLYVRPLNDLAHDCALVIDKAGETAFDALLYAEPVGDIQSVRRGVQRDLGHLDQ